MRTNTSTPSTTRYRPPASTPAHLNPDVRTAIGGGEHAHPGDVVATRRNDRTLVTDAGEPVRNRELWTVTATHPNGALTVTHLSGHGTVTLPADYTRQHVRLGYAATEHGNQSDTVTASTELVTPATTRRGLYVGVTRGQQDNTIRVVTDSHDLDEARDVLEAVLATDRADVPAVTQRRQLTAALPPAPTLRARCVIPNWFDDTYHQAAAELADAHEALDEQRRQDARIERRIRDLTDDLNELQPRCAPWDTAIAAAHADVNQAQNRKRHAERAVTDSGPLGRRAARRELTNATDNLAGTETALAELTRCAAPLLDQRNQLRDERDHLHRHATTNRKLLRLLDDHETTVADAQHTVDALETLKRWATGYKVLPEQLTDAVNVLHHTDRADHRTRRTTRHMDGPTPPRTATAVRRILRAAARTTRSRDRLLTTTPSNRVMSCRPTGTAHCTSPEARSSRAVSIGDYRAASWGLRFGR